MELTFLRSKLLSAALKRKGNMPLPAPNSIMLTAELDPFTKRRVLATQDRRPLVD